MATVNFSLPDGMRDWLNAQVESGAYASASDYLRDLIRHDMQAREELQNALIEGEKSGISHRSFNEIIATSRAGLAGD